MRRPLVTLVCLALTVAVATAASIAGCGGDGENALNGSIPVDQGMDGGAGSDGSTAGASGAAGHAGSGGKGAGGGHAGTSSTGGGGGIKDASTDYDNSDCAVIPPKDPTMLGVACCDAGAAHCVPASDVNPAVVSYFTSCDQSSGKGAGICVGDTQIKEGSAYQPKSCSFNNPDDAVCLSACIPAVLNDPASVLLSQKTCELGELCVPCINPLTKQPTGACDLPPACTAHDGGTDGGKGGSGGTNDAGSGCPYTGPPIFDPSALPPCGPACAGAHCLPSALVPDAQKSLLATCTGASGAGYCAPDELIASGGEGLPTACVSVAGAEGRCLSTCVPAVAEQAAVLPQSTCAAGHLCAPCFNPFAADPTMSTGACSVACDAPAKPPTQIMCPYTGAAIVDVSKFPDCSPACGGAHCVPSILIPDSQKSQLMTCPGGYCAPDSLTASGGKGLPASCVSVAGSEGRCLSACLPAVSSQLDALPVSTCAADERCAPCFNPFAADPTMPTGACSLACDAPKEPPTEITCPYTGPPVVDVTKFTDCAPACGGAHCVPADLIPDSQKSQLGMCPGGYCAPDSLTETGGKGIPASCVSVAGAEGRCLSECLPAVSSQLDVLPASTCGAGERCAPCFNPFADDPTLATGACSLACDAPKDPPTLITCPYSGPAIIDPKSFPDCAPACGGAHCLPSALVPVAQQSQLTACSGGFCTPDSIIASGGKSVPASCDPFPGSGDEGRCLSLCLPAIQMQASQLSMSSCGGGELCAPCYDPFTGADTGACETACDKPKASPFTFPLCCDFNGQKQGTCVPGAELTTAQKANLQADVCPSNSAMYSCVPDEYLPGSTTPIKTCNNLILGKGACVSKCAKLPPTSVVLTQDVCSANHICVPCSLASTTPGCM